jgi:hypothetical protein
MPVDPGAEMGIGKPIDRDITVPVCFFVFCKFLVPSVVCVRARVRACVRACVCHQHVFADDIHRIHLESINFKKKKMKKIAGTAF